jgi:hypothetical protein
MAQAWVPCSDAAPWRAPPTARCSSGADPWPRRTAAMNFKGVFIRGRHTWSHFVRAVPARKGAEAFLLLAGSGIGDIIRMSGRRNRCGLEDVCYAICLSATLLRGWGIYHRSMTTVLPRDAPASERPEQEGRSRLSSSRTQANPEFIRWRMALSPRGRCQHRPPSARWIPVLHLAQRRDGYPAVRGAACCRRSRCPRAAVARRQ